MSISSFFIGSTSSSSLAPTTLLRRCVSRLRLSHTGGSFPACPATFPTRESDFTIEGSRDVRTPIDPPGWTSLTSAPPVLSVFMNVFIGLYIILFSFSIFLPGLSSISSPTLSFPCTTAPPKTPPTMPSGADPGLFMSKLLAMNISGSFESSLFGVGMVFSMVSIRRSMLMLCFADIGIIGASL